MGDKMKTENVKVYIVISQTGTILSRIIKLLTRKNYNHASISLDKELNEMYEEWKLKKLFVGESSKKRNGYKGSGYQFDEKGLSRE